MQLHLIRHTLPDFEPGICYGSADLEVAASFPEEGAAIRNVLPNLDERIQIYTSPLKRCTRLAQLIAGNKPVTIEPRLKEISFGDWEMKPWKSVGKERLKEWRKNFVSSPPPNGESFQSVFDRVMDFYQQLQQQPDRHYWLVCHSGVIRAFLCRFRGTPLHQAFDEKLEYGVVYKVNQERVEQVK